MQTSVVSDFSLLNEHERDTTQPKHIASVVFGMMAMGLSTPGSKVCLLEALLEPPAVVGAAQIVSVWVGGCLCV